MVGEAKHKFYDNFYARLCTKYGEKDIYIYKLAKLKEKKTRDVCQITCIKGEDSRVFVKYVDITER